MKKLCMLAAILFAAVSVQATDLSSSFINLDFDAGGVSNPFHGFDAPNSPEIIGWGNWKNGAYTNYLNDAGVEGPGAWWAPYENNAAFISASDGATNMGTHIIGTEQTYTVDFWCKRWEWTSGSADGELTATLYYNDPANVIGSFTVTNISDNSHWEQRVGYIDSIPAAVGGNLGVYFHNSLANGDICTFDELQIRVDPFVISGLGPTGVLDQTNQTITVTVSNINSSTHLSTLLSVDGFLVQSNTAGGTVRSLSYNDDFTLGLHTAKVVSTSASLGSMTNEWTFDIFNPAFVPGSDTWIPGWWWIVNPVHWPQESIEFSIVDDYCQLDTNSVTVTLDGFDLTPIIDRSTAPTTTISAYYGTLVEGYHTGVVQFVGIPYGSYSNEWVFIYVDEDTTQPTNLVHHWAFDEGDGTNVADSVGGFDGMVVGTNYSWNSDGLHLDGQGWSDWWNAGNTNLNNGGAYVDLPNGILATLPDAALTVEATFIVDSWDEDWTRIFDFGCSATSNGIVENVVGTGDSWFMLCPDANWADALRFEVAAPGESRIAGVDNWEGPGYGVRCHVVVIYDSVNARMLMYRNGTLVGAIVDIPGLPFGVSGITDINNWFGRSNWGGDRMFGGTLIDIRIYEGAMTTPEVAARYEAMTPFAATKIPNIQSLTVAGGLATLVWDSETNATYYVLTKSSLTDPAWATNGSGVVSAGDTTTTTSVTASATAEFYKIEARP